MTLPSLTEDALTAVSRIVMANVSRSYPMEAAGLIWVDGVVTTLPAVVTEGTFVVSADNLYDVLAKRPESSVLSVYHSHPSGNSLPSETDLACMKQYHDAGLELAWSIVSFHSDYLAMSTYRWNPSGPLSLIHRITHRLDW